MYAVVDKANEPERVAWLEETYPGIRLVNVPLVRRSEQPVRSFPYGFTTPLWTGHERFGNHAVAYLANAKTWRSLCGRSFFQSTFDEEINEARCSGCTSAMAPILYAREMANRRGGFGKMEVIGSNARTFWTIRPGEQFDPGFDPILDTGS